MLRKRSSRQSSYAQSGVPNRCERLLEVITMRCFFGALLKTMERKPGCSILWARFTHTLSEHAKALPFHKQALLLSRKVEDCYEEVEGLNSLAYAYIALGRNQEALERSNQALKLSQAVKHRAGQAQAMNNIGEVMTMLWAISRTP